MCGKVKMYRFSIPRPKWSEPHPWLFVFTIVLLVLIVL